MCILYNVVLCIAYQKSDQLDKIYVYRSKPISGKILDLLKSVGKICKNMKIIGYEFISFIQGFGSGINLSHGSGSNEE